MNSFVLTPFYIWLVYVSKILYFIEFQSSVIIISACLYALCSLIYLFSFICFFLFTWRAELHTELERKEWSYTCWCASQMSIMPGLGWVKPRSQEHHLGPPYGGMDQVLKLSSVFPVTLVENWLENVNQISTPFWEP